MSWWNLLGVVLSVAMAFYMGRMFERGRRQRTYAGRHLLREAREKQKREAQWDIDETALHPTVAVPVVTDAQHWRRGPGFRPWDGRG